MENGIWHLKSDFLKKPAKDVLIQLLQDDGKNYDKANSEMRKDIILLDDAMILYIVVLQAAYAQVDKWKNNDSNRGSLAMLGSIFNYVLLSRHGMLLGYYPEVRDLLRSCYERITRSYLFSLDDNIARRFLNGEQIKQVEVDDKLSKLEKESGQRNELLKALREYYKSISGVVHPNLESFEGRYGKEGLKERVGLNILVGGLTSTQLAHLYLMVLIQTVLSVLRVLKVMLSEQSGNWENEYQRISNSYRTMLDQIKASDK